MPITYVRGGLTPRSADQLAAFAARHGIPNAQPAEKMHCTVLYSTEPLPDAASPPPAGLYPREAAANGWAAWDVAGKHRHLVLRIASDDLQARHAQLLAMGGSHPFQPYDPHVTVSKDVGQDFDASALPAYDGLVEIEGEAVELR